MAKASVWNSSDGEGRRLGERLGLDIVSCYEILCQSNISTTKYPSSPSSKQCPLGVTVFLGDCGAGA